MLLHLFWCCVASYWSFEVGFEMAESAHRRAQPGSDAGDDATTSEPSVGFVIGRARITSAARITLYPDTCKCACLVMRVLRRRQRSRACACGMYMHVHVSMCMCMMCMCMCACNRCMGKLHVCNGFVTALCRVTSCNRRRKKRCPPLRGGWRNPKKRCLLAGIPLS